MRQIAKLIDITLRINKTFKLFFKHFSSLCDAFVFFYYDKISALTNVVLVFVTKCRNESSNGENDQQ